MPHFTFPHYPHYPHSNVDEIFDKNPLFSFKKCCAIIHRYQVRGKISFFTLTSYYYDIRVKRSKSRSRLHDKTFELGTRQT